MEDHTTDPDFDRFDVGTADNCLVVADSTPDAFDARLYDPDADDIGNVDYIFEYAGPQTVMFAGVVVHRHDETLDDSPDADHDGCEVFTVEPEGGGVCERDFPDAVGRVVADVTRPGIGIAVPQRAVELPLDDLVDDLVDEIRDGAITSHEDLDAAIEDRLASYLEADGVDPDIVDRMKGAQAPDAATAVARALDAMLDDGVPFDLDGVDDQDDDEHVRGYQ